MLLFRSVGPFRTLTSAKREEGLTSMEHGVGAHFPEPLAVLIASYLPKKVIFIPCSDGSVIGFSPQFQEWYPSQHFEFLKGARATFLNEKHTIYVSRTRGQIYATPFCDHPKCCEILVHPVSKEEVDEDHVSQIHRGARLQDCKTNGRGLICANNEMAAILQRDERGLKLRIENLDPRNHGTYWWTQNLPFLVDDPAMFWLPSGRLCIFGESCVPNRYLIRDVADDEKYMVDLYKCFWEVWTPKWVTFKNIVWMTGDDRELVFVNQVSCSSVCNGSGSHFWLYSFASTTNTWTDLGYSPCLRTLSCVGLWRWVEIAEKSSFQTWASSIFQC